MRLLPGWCGVAAAAAAAGGRDGLPGQRRFRGRRAAGVVPVLALPAPAVPLSPLSLFFAVPFVLATPFVEAGACFRATGFAPGFFAGGSVGLGSGRTGFWPGRGASACRLATV